MVEIKDKFYVNGEPFQIISGSFHYFRTMPEYWEDRLIKLKNMGCNTVETYIPWNFHEPNEGEFIWEGIRDFGRFFKLAQDLGLYAIVRPSPYICSEWEFGGLPAWLLRDRNMRLRCTYKPYLDAVYRYYRELIPRIAEHELDRGGNIILCQIENEYGYYGNDKNYLQFLADTMREFGMTVPFVTSDGPWSEACFKSGQLEGALPTGNFGSAMDWQFDRMREFMPDKPLMCMEFWVGWFDAWGEEHHTSDLEKNKEDLEIALKRGNLNFYMYEGGTSFGFMSGRNENAKTADVTSYDYDSPLTEDGRITPKYRAFREIIGKYAPVYDIPTIEIPRREFGKLKIERKVSLLNTLDNISEPISSPYPLTMEEAGQNYGYILYRMNLPEFEAAEKIFIDGGHDRAVCLQNGVKLFSADEYEMEKEIEVTGAEKGAMIDILIENTGRVNFGRGLENQRKGIVNGVTVNGHRHFGFDIYTLPLEGQTDKIDWYGGYSEGTPAFYEATFTADEAADTFVELSGFGSGYVFINEFCLGRFREEGPQRRLYLPEPLMKNGENSIIIFEAEGKAGEEIFLSSEPKLS